ncbi:GNAT family N-acetyltransferase [Marinomonas pollencensis]|nr:GNAT family N-acetyltransferase [Marinomonas pollencensis]
MKSDIGNCLIMQRATLAHINDILQFEAQNQQWFAEFLPRKTLLKQDKNYFQKQLSDTHQSLQYLVYYRSEKIIGRFCVQRLNDAEKSVEISYRIEKKYTQKGVGRYVLRRLLAIISCYGVNSVYAYVGEGNKASIRLLVSCGFAHIDTDAHSINLSTGIQDRLSFKWVNPVLLD